MSTNEYANTTKCHNRQLSHGVMEQEEEEEDKSKPRAHAPASLKGRGGGEAFHNTVRCKGNYTSWGFSHHWRHDARELRHHTVVPLGSRGS